MLIKRFRFVNLGDKFAPHQGNGNVGIDAHLTIVITHLSPEPPIAVLNAITYPRVALVSTRKRRHMIVAVIIDIIFRHPCPASTAEGEITNAAIPPVDTFCTITQGY